MKLSKYTVFYDINEEYGVLFNTFNGFIVQILKNSYSKLKNEFDKKLLENLFEGASSIVEQRFCIVDDVDKIELEEKLLKNQNSKEKLTITIVTTLSCNLSCEYCYQQGLVDRTMYLSIDIAQKIKEWVINKIYTLSPKNITVHFYGGEPLLNLDVLDEIMPEIMQAALANKAKFTSYITTNGILLNYENIQRLKKWNLDNAQISIDGPKRVHEQRRSGIKNSYDIIIENIGIALDEGLHVVIRINIDKQNLPYIEDLFKDLKKRGYEKFYGLQINIEIVSPIMNPSEHCVKYTFNKQDELLALVDLWKKQVDYGFPIKSIMPIDSACENLVKNSYTFSANGDIYMCPGFIGIKDFAIGNIKEHGVDYEKYMKLLNNNVWKKCIDCEYVPVCQGGCKMCAYVSFKEAGHVYCRKDFVSAVYPEFIKSKYGL